MGQTVNLLVYTFGGSNPSSPTLLLRNNWQNLNLKGESNISALPEADIGRYIRTLHRLYIAAYSDYRVRTTEYLKATGQLEHGDSTVHAQSPND